MSLAVRIQIYHYLKMKSRKSDGNEADISFTSTKITSPTAKERTSRPLGKKSLSAKIFINLKRVQHPRCLFYVGINNAEPNLFSMHVCMF